ncbi:MAG: metallophosphoesterase family protein [Bacteroidetes bacterium]|nr:metallophosphoesterase family protein [Bacteroidota bacterium]
MKRIGLLSDTHGYLHPKIFNFFSECDEIWHAGDIGNFETSAKLSEFKILRAVYGNIDGTEIRATHPRIQRFYCEEVSVMMTHIGGYPGRYEKDIKPLLQAEKPKLFIAGHSHILKVIYDQKLGLLHMNPGAAGKSGLHKVITFVRFVIDGQNIRDLEVFEAERLNKEMGY